MTIGETLLNLTVEYQESLTSRDQAPVYGGEPVGREPEQIAADYETAIRELL